MLDEEKGRKRSKRKAEKQRQENIAVLQKTAAQIALMLCEASAERDFFISDGAPAKRRLDTKALKEFASVLKEVCSVIAELDSDGMPAGDTVRIEFSDEAQGYSS